jgi:hypothetical protein
MPRSHRYSTARSSSNHASTNLTSPAPVERLFQPGPGQPVLPGIHQDLLPSIGHLDSGRPALPSIRQLALPSSDQPALPGIRQLALPSSDQPDPGLSSIHQSAPTMGYGHTQEPEHDDYYTATASGSSLSYQPNLVPYEAENQPVSYQHSLPPAVPVPVSQGDSRHFTCHK